MGAAVAHLTNVMSAELGVELPADGAVRGGGPLHGTGLAALCAQCFLSEQRRV